MIKRQLLKDKNVIFDCQTPILNFCFVKIGAIGRYRKLEDDLRLSKIELKLRTCIDGYRNLDLGVFMKNITINLEIFIFINS